MRRLLIATCLALTTLPAVAPAQESAPAGEERKNVRQLVREGSASIPVLQRDLASSDRAVQLQATQAISLIGTQHSLDPLIQATRSNDPEVQIVAVQGLVNFYQPGYVKPGIGGSVRRLGTTIKDRFTDTNDQVIDPSITVRPAVIDALGKVARGGTSLESRAEAARALGILRGRAAVPDLVAAARSKNDRLIYESLIALQKIKDPAAAPQITFLLRDLDDRIQMAALETTGLLQNREALPDLRDAVDRARNDKVRRAALSALAMIPDERNRPHFQRFFAASDPALRAGAFEGYARLRHQPDRPSLEQAFAAEKKMEPRLALAFALVSLGRREIAAGSALQYLVNTLNSKAWRGVSQAYLIELSRDPELRRILLPQMPAATRDEKVGLAQVLLQTGGPESVTTLESLSQDPDSAVAQEAIRALKVVRTRS